MEAHNVLASGRMSEVEQSQTHLDDEDEDDYSELSSSPSIPEGEIDFDFVYALHTFLATVEGEMPSVLVSGCSADFTHRTGNLPERGHFSAAG